MSKKNIFKDVPQKRVPRNLFDLSHEVKMSGKFGWLYPVLLLDTMPGDVVRDTMSAMIRFAPMLAPIMHRVDVKTDFFFVPTRIISESWMDFITGGQDGDLAPVQVFSNPQYFLEDSMRKGTLWDYLGLPVLEGALPASVSTESISILPFKAYQKIFNDYFRDPNLDDEIELDETDEGEIADLTKLTRYLTMRYRGWDKDYFTSALPFAQRGPAVLMPFDAEVTYRDQTVIRKSSDDSPHALSDVLKSTVNTNVAGGLVGETNVTRLFVDNIESVSSSNITINDLRRSMAIQSWLENNARGGARYNEQILSHFNTRVPDYRVQRAEYLGGGRQPVTISEVLSTAEGESVPVGDMAGHGISVGRSNRFTYHCQEHGFVIGIMSIVPKTAYDQGIDRMWSRQDKFDYAWPELANLGEQEILSKEIFYSFNQDHAAANNGVFGYIPRYAEYKFKNDRLAGDFRDNLAFWHLSRIFLSRPTLSSAFMQMNENTAAEETYRRIFAVTDGTDYLWIQLFHKLTAKRPLPYFGVPMLNG